MPPKRSNIGRRARTTQRETHRIASECNEQRSQRIELNRESTSRSRSRQSQEEREVRNNDDRLRMRHNRRLRGTSQELLNTRIQRQTRHTENLHRAAFAYNNTVDYSLHPSVIIGTMSKECQHCKALKFKTETLGMCCANGKVKLPVLNYPPEPLRSLLSGTAPHSKHFLANIQTYNSCFQMTSFGATNIITDNFMPTFKVISSYGVTNMNFDNFDNSTTTAVYDLFLNSDPTSEYFTSTLQIQGQIYHKAGSLLPFPDAAYQFLQIYFIGDSNEETNQRCVIVRIEIQKEN